MFRGTQIRRQGWVVDHKSNIAIVLFVCKGYSAHCWRKGVEVKFDQIQGLHLPVCGRVKNLFWSFITTAVVHHARSN